MPDSTYQPKVYRRQGGDELVVANGGIITVESGGQINLLAPNGAIYFVDANIAASGDGLSWGNAFKTMAEAFAVIGSGDTIIFRGKVLEQLTTPVQVFDVTIIGAGNRPRHADSTPDGGQDAANSWVVPAAPAAATPLVKVLQQGWKFINILFAGPADAASVLLFRDGGAGDAERDASHAEFHGCRFASGQDGIEASGGPYNIGIYGCRFHDLTGYCINHTAGAGIAACYRWQIVGNDFSKCANWIDKFDGNSWEILNNTITQITTNYIDTSGGAGYNTIVGNRFSVAAAAFDPTGKVKGHATDVWSNYLIDAIETGLPAD